MSHSFESHNNETKRPTVYKKGEKKYLGVHDRGVSYVMGPDLPLLKFPDVPGTDKYVRVLDMDNDEDCKMWEAVKVSKPFLKGVIHYIKSPQELQEEAKQKKQAEQLKTILDMMDGGILTLTDLNKMTSPKLYELADSIGAVCTYYNKASGKDQTLRKEVLIKNIRIKLGIESGEQELEQDQEKDQEESP